MCIQQGKTNWKFLVIVIILAVIVGGGTFWFMKTGNFNLNLPQISIKNETANWLTYTNNKYGFQIKYPQLLESVNSEDGLRIASALHGVSIYDISIYPNPQNLLPEDFFISQMNSSRIVSVGDTVLGEQKIEGKKIVWDENNITILIPKGNFIIEIVGEPVFDDEEFLNIFNQMLFTFKFLE